MQGLSKQTLRSGRQGPVRVVAVPVGGFVECILNVFHEIQHCAAADSSIILSKKNDMTIH